MLGFGALKSVLFQVSPGGVLLAVRARKEKEGGIIDPGASPRWGTLKLADFLLSPLKNHLGAWRLI